MDEQSTHMVSATANIFEFIRRQNRWNEGNGKVNQHASTPVSESHAPPLITPMIQRKYSSPAGSTTGGMPPTQAYTHQHNDNALYQEPDHTAMQSYNSNLTQQSDHDSAHSYQQQLYTERQQVYGAAMDSYPSSHTTSSDITPHTHHLHQYPSPDVQHVSPRFHAVDDRQLELSECEPQHNAAGANGGYNQYDSGKGESRRHLTGGDLDNTVFAESQGQRTSNDILQGRYFQEGMILISSYLPCKIFLSLIFCIILF